MPDPAEPSAPRERPSAPPIRDWLRVLVRLMDDAFRIPGTDIRIGWDAILGFLLPGVGDAATAVSQIAILLAALRARAPWIVIARMILNVGIDSLLGSVPLLGDVFDAGFKANRKNLELLERLEGVGTRPARATDYVVVALAIGLVLALIAAPLVLAVWLLSKL